MKKGIKYRVEKMADGRYIIQVTDNEFRGWKSVSTHENCVEALDKLDKLRKEYKDLSEKLK